MDFDRLNTLIESLGCTVLREEPLSLHTSFQIGGRARLFVRSWDTPSLQKLIALLKTEQVPWMLIGKGSNLLASDQGFEGCVIQLGHSGSKTDADGEEKAGLRLLPDGGIYAGAGEALAKLCLFARDHSLTGMEFAWGIPGSVGGAICMNAGAYGGEMKDVLRAVSILDETGEERTLPAEELELAYRHSVFMEKDWIITGAEFALQPGDRELIKDQMEELYARRREKQPLEYPSAGSAFKRPQGAYAAALIDQCGLKGLQVGGARVSEKHSGFIINVGGATARDVHELMRQVVQTVWEKTGYRLEPEVQGLPEGLLADLNGKD